MPRFSDDSMSRRRFRIRFSLRALLISAVLLAIAGGLVASHFRRIHQHKMAMEYISQHGGTTLIFNDRAAVVVFRNAPDCWTIKGLTDGYGGNRDQMTFSDPHVNSLPRIKGLTILDLEGTQITDQSVRAIAALPDLRIVCTRNSGLTTQGIAALLSMRPDLHVVDKDWWRVEDADKFLE